MWFSLYRIFLNSFSSDSLTSCDTVKASHLQKPARTPHWTKPSIFCRSSAVLKQNNWVQRNSGKNSGISGNLTKKVPKFRNFQNGSGLQSLATFDCELLRLGWLRLKYVLSPRISVCKWWLLHLDRQCPENDGNCRRQLWDSGARATLSRIFIDRVAGAIIRLVASVCVCPFVCGQSPVWTVWP